MWDELKTAYRRIDEGVVPAVVSIGRAWGRGCGVVVGPNRVVTNAHNIHGDEVTVTFADGRVATGAVRGADLDADLGVLEVDTADVAPVVWAPSPPTLGDPIFAVTNPGARRPRVTFGTVSSVDREFRGPRGRRIAGSVEHTASLPRGSSGSPIVDPDGRLLGLSTNRLGDGFYLALPADETLRQTIDRLGRGEVPTRPRLGIGLASTRAARQLRAAVGLPERDGLLVRVVEESGPGAAAGLRQGDLIVAAGGQPVRTADDLFALLDRQDPSAALVLTIVRGTEEHDVSVSFG